MDTDSWYLAVTRKTFLLRSPTRSSRVEGFGRKSLSLLNFIYSKFNKDCVLFFQLFNCYDINHTMSIIYNMTVKAVFRYSIFRHFFAN